MWNIQRETYDALPGRLQGGPAIIETGSGP